MKKRIFTVIIATLLCILSLIMANAGYYKFQKQMQYNNQFKDVQSSSWYYESVKNAYEYGFINGTSETTFSPNQTLTEAEKTVLLARIHAKYNGNQIDTAMTSDWSAPYYEYVKAYIDENYEGDGVIKDAKSTRWSFAYWLSKALPDLEYEEINKIPDGYIPDLLEEELGSDVVDRIYMLYRAGILTGSGETGEFKPYSNITRSEVATILVRMIDKSMRLEITLPKPTYKITTAYKQDGVYCMLVDNKGSLYYSTENEIYKDGQILFDGNYPITISKQTNSSYYEEFEFKNWSVANLLTDAKNEKVYALLYSYIPYEGENAIMCIDLKTGQILGKYMPDIFNYEHFVVTPENARRESSLITDSGDILYYNGEIYWDLKNEPVRNIGKADYNLSTDDLHIGYSNGEIYGIGESVVYFNYINGMQSIKLENNNYNWSTYITASSSYNGKFYTKSYPDFNIIEIDPINKTVECLIDETNIKVLDSTQLDTNIQSEECSIIAAGSDVFYLYYPYNSRIRKIELV